MSLVDITLLFVKFFEVFNYKAHKIWTIFTKNIFKNDFTCINSFWNVVSLSMCKLVVCLLFMIIISSSAKRSYINAICCRLSYLCGRNLGFLFSVSPCLEMLSMRNKRNHSRFTQMFIQINDLKEEADSKWGRLVLLSGFS